MRSRQLLSSRSNARPAPLSVTVEAALRQSGRPVAGSLAAGIAPRFGADFSKVRIHSGPDAEAAARSLGASAFTMGDHIVLGPTVSPRVLAHELAHVAQNARAPAAPDAGAVSHPNDAAEREAGTAAGQILAGGAASVAAAPSAVIGRDNTPPLASGSGWFPSQQVAPPGPPEFNVFEVPEAATPKGAPAAFEAYDKLAADDKRKAFEWSLRTGNLAKALRALGAEQAADPKYRAIVQDLLRRVQEAETRKESGKTDEQMADAQQAFMEANAKAAAAAAAPPGTAPTADQVKKAHEGIVAKSAIPPQSATAKKFADLPKAEQDQWNADGAAVVSGMVTYAATNYPKLALKADHFRVAFQDVQDRGLGVLAFSEKGPLGSRLAIGFSFVRTAKVNPAYMIEVVVHELFGHPEFEAIGNTYDFSLYGKAASKMMPGWTPSQADYDSFGYHETEIYSILRGFQYHHAVEPADANKNITRLADPKDEVARYVAKIKQEWAPGLQVALLRGLYRRLALDPRMVTAALDAFRAVIRAAYAATDADAILK